MKQQEKEKIDTRNSLKKVKPVSPIAVVNDIRPGFSRDYYPINGMEEERQKYPEDLQKKQIGYLVNVLYRLYETRLTVHRFRVSEHVDEEEYSERHDARQLMQLSQEKGFREFYRHSLSAALIQFLL